VQQVESVDPIFEASVVRVWTKSVQDCVRMYMLVEHQLALCLAVEVALAASLRLYPLLRHPRRVHSISGHHATCFCVRMVSCRGQSQLYVCTE
jgi:hypothetical protein